MPTPTGPTHPSAPEPPEPHASPAGLPPTTMLLVFVVVLLACAFPSYLAYEHPAAREPLALAIGILSALGTLYNALRR